MGKDNHNAQVYRATVNTITRSGKPATHASEERARRGEGVNLLIDPRSKGGQRVSSNAMEERPDRLWLLMRGIAMGLVNISDLTGSMKNYIDDIFLALGGIQSYVVQGQRSPLHRYQVQMATGAVTDTYYYRQRPEQWLPLQFSQFEGGNKIEEQMQMLVSPREGNDTDVEDYQLPLFYLAYRINAAIWNYGLKGYCFLIGDEIGRDEVTRRDETYLGGSIDRTYKIEEICHELLSKWHFCFLQVNTNPSTSKWWSRYVGHERVVYLDHPRDIPYVEAVFCGLTEGIITLSDAADFLSDTTEIEKSRSRRIVQSLAHIPLRAQADLPGFNTVPLAGSVFAAEKDVWPIDHATSSEPLWQPSNVDSIWQL